MYKDIYQIEKQELLSFQPILQELAPNQQLKKLFQDLFRR